MASNLIPYPVQGGMNKLTTYIGIHMQRLQITGGAYTFSRAWTGHVLYGVPEYYGVEHKLIGYTVYFPHAVGGSDTCVGLKNKWYFRNKDCHLLPPIPAADKPRFTITNEVWAKVLPIERDNALDCAGCTYRTDHAKCLTAPACHSSKRFDKRDVIFVTGVEKW